MKHLTKRRRSSPTADSSCRRRSSFHRHDNPRFQHKRLDLPYPLRSHHGRIKRLQNHRVKLQSTNEIPPKRRRRSRTGLATPTFSVDKNHNRRRNPPHLSKKPATVAAQHGGGKNHGDLFSFPKINSLKRQRFKDTDEYEVDLESDLEILRKLGEIFPN
ncbi:hypothetical protein G4B88_001974 [Cannabis sativa]|uniref:Uncharacterized protein n=1 Tax=Cannabis sativa TaxID=3483 RepID=A0A7J6HFN6_CANSA|nr:hypothetical protein G4B88_001974 [Cannabis sativa]